ncbi:MAG: glycosyltransferase family 4 protein [Fervidobacterium sp.]
MKAKTGLIFASYPLLERSGGPSTYLYNLKKGFSKIGIDDIFIESLVSDHEKGTKSNLNTIKTRRVFKEKIKYLSYNNFPRLTLNLLIRKNKKHYRTNSKKFWNIYDELSEKYDIKFIHFHSTIDLYSWLLKAEKDVPLVLTSHSPEASHHELTKDFQKRVIEKLSIKSSSKDIILEIFSEYFERIDEIAFENADYLMFPCEEALEPYFNSWSKFEQLIDRKNIFFVPTGTSPLSYKIDRQSFRKMYNIPEKAFVASYVGRHVEVKGYDLLCESAEHVWKKNPNVYFLIAGKEEPLKGLKDNRWIEVGWTNDPGSVINASDVFVLPNRNTFFDLVLLEVLSLGKPALVSYTGGNKFVSKQSEGIITFESLTGRSLADKILQLSICEQEFFEKLGKSNYELYNSFYTVEAFAKRYREKVGTIFFAQD